MNLIDALRKCAGLLIGALLAANVAAEPIATHGIVASANPLATDAGLGILKHGGNAIDAAVATGLALGAVDPYHSGIGGGCFMLIHLASGTNICIDGREMAPGAATRDMFVLNGTGDTNLSQTGPLASGVPGEVAAFDYAVRHFGKKTLADDIHPAEELAENGFKLGNGCAKAIAGERDSLKKFEAAAGIYLPGGKPARAGEIFRETDLAKSYQNIARNGADWFYRGPFAQAAGTWMKTHGGIMTAEDFANYHVEIRQAIDTDYRGFDVVSFPPPSSGGVHVLEMLNILENFNIAQMPKATRYHVIAEAMKLAFADRAHWLGDPDFSNVPRGLIDKSYAAGLAKKISLDHATKVPSHGMPPGWQSDFFKKHTTHFSVADDEGNWVACTATINTYFGSKVVVPGTGVVMNDEMDDFSVQPGVPNAFGLIGGEANSIAPRKRPLSSMSPAIVFKNGQPIIALGAAGGPRIISAVLQELVDMLDFGMTPTEAEATPRIHQQWSPDELVVEDTLPDGVIKSLESRGHKIKKSSAVGISQIVARSKDGQSFIGAADPRGAGSTAAW